MHSKFFEFRSWYKAEQRAYEVRVLFLHAWIRLPRELGSRLDQIVRGPRPDAVIVITSANKYDEVIAAFHGEREELVNGLERLREADVGLAITNYDCLSGHKNAPLQVLQGEFLKDIDLARLGEAIWSAGSKEIVRRRNVAKFAPPGCIFEKPSGRLAEVFLRAQDLLQCEAEIFFLCARLLGMIDTLPDEPEVIYLDTMGIHSLAVVLASLMAKPDIRPRIETFSSYDGLKTFRPLSSEPAIFLISASTSGGLAEDLLQVANVSRKKIIALLEVEELRENCCVLLPVNIGTAQTEVRAEDPAALGSARVPIIGEFFAPAPAPTRSVLIGRKHRVKESSQFWYARRSTCPLRVRTDATQSSGTAAMLIGEQLLGDEDFMKWWKRQVRAKFPLSTRHVVYAVDNDTERQFAEQIAKFVCEELGGIDITVSSPEDIDGNVAHSILVTSLGGADHLSIVNASRVLRDTAPDADRFFIVGPLLARENAEIAQTLADLCVEPKGRHYRAECFLRLSVGLGSSGLTWEMERQFLERELSYRPPESAQAAADLGQRLSMLEASVLANPFLPSPSDVPMRLSRGFAFWQGEYEVEKVDPWAVLFTIADVAQNARELHGLSPEDRLYSLGHEPVLISPRTFDRFSDGIIQAALLRSAVPKELRYDLDEGKSAQLAELICDLVSHCDARRGEAALEFAMSIALGHLRLMDKDRAKVVRSAAAAPLKAELLSWLLEESTAG